MSSVQANSQSPFTASSAPVGNSIQDLNLDVFLNLMLTELQNQDPLNPMDNQEMLNTISQIREISANDRLSETLDSVLLGQNVTTATGLIGSEVEGLTDDGRRVTGEVLQVSISDGAPRLELAVATNASAAELEGDIEAGVYEYEVVWKTEDGYFSVPVSVDTEDLGEDFQGAIRLSNLPELDENVVGQIYRSNGAGQSLLVGTLPLDSDESFVDTKANKDLPQDKAIPSERTPLIYADAVEVKLSNIANVQRRN